MKTSITSLILLIILISTSFAIPPQNTSIGWAYSNDVTIGNFGNYYINTNNISFDVKVKNDNHIDRIYYTINNDNTFYKIDLENGFGETTNFSAGDIVSLYLDNYDITYWKNAKYSHHDIDQVFITDKHKYDSKWKVIINVTPKTEIPTGQPLPGVLSTMIISCGVFGYFFMRRKK